MDNLSVDTCRICSGPCRPVGLRRGELAQRDFQVFQCQHCWYSFVKDPILDAGSIYDEAYYSGRGADPRVDYLGEVTSPKRTIRSLEWLGVMRRVGSLCTEEDPHWLDYGCGIGGLVHYLRTNGLTRVFGFDEGWSATWLQRHNMPTLSRTQLLERRGSFDVVTAIELIEHVVDPVAELTQMRSLLRPGGLLFLTTGNARPYRKHIAHWRYLIPEIHISLFEPGTLEAALRAAGFDVTYPGYGPGWTQIIEYKVLKNVRRRHLHGVDRFGAWPLVARAADLRWGFSSHPVGWAPARVL